MSKIELFLRIATDGIQFPLIIIENPEQEQEMQTELKKLNIEVPTVRLAANNLEQILQEVDSNRSTPDFFTENKAIYLLDADMLGLQTEKKQDEIYSTFTPIYDPQS